MSTSWWVMVENGQTVLQSHTWIIHPIQRLWAISGVLDSNIYKNLFIILGASAQKGKKRAQIWLGSCVFERKWFIKNGKRYMLTPHASSHCRPIWSATVLKDPSHTASKIDTLRAEASAISASTAGETIRHSWVFASIPLFREGWTAWTNMGD